VNIFNVINKYWKMLMLSDVLYLFEKKFHNNIHIDDFLKFPDFDDHKLKLNEFINRMCFSYTLSKSNIIIQIYVHYKKYFISFFLLSFVSTVVAILVPINLMYLLSQIKGGIVDIQITTISIIGLIGIVVLRSFLISHVHLRSRKLYIVIRRFITKVILNKVIQLGSKSLDEKNSGEIQQLIHSDSHLIAEYSILLLNFILVIIQMISLMGLLFWQLGITAIYAVLGFIFILVVQFLLTRYIYGQLSDMRKLTDKRLSLLSEILNKFRLIRMSGLTGRFKSRVNTIRDKETELLFNVNLIQSILQVVVIATPTFLSMVTFSIYLWQGQTLDIVTIFSVIALFAFLRGPILMLSDIVFQLVAGRIALSRIKNFLNNKKLYVSLNNESLDYGGIEISELNLIKNNSKILKNISLEIYPNELVALCGNTGCGKTALLNLIAGYDSQYEGNIKRRGSVVHTEHYMSLNNDTIRNNILFGKNISEKRYFEVIAKCQLKNDFSMLPLGDQTLVGEMGTRLSGGQLQRVILARAFYSDAKIMLFDNPLSAIDPLVAKKIMLEALLPAKDITRLIVTHDNDLIKRCDRVLELKDGLLQEVIFDQSKHYDNIEKLEIESSMYVGHDIEEVYVEEEVQTGNVTLSLIKEVFGQTGKSGMLVLILILMVLFEMLRFGSEIFLAVQSESVFNSATSFLYDYLLLVFLSLFFLLISRLVILSRIRNQSLASHKNLLNGLFDAPLIFFDNTPIGRIVSRFGVDIEACSGSLFNAITVVVTISLSLLALILFISWKVPLFLIVVFVIVFFYWKLQSNYRFSTRTIRRKISIIRSSLYSSVSEVIKNSPAVRLSNNESYVLDNVMSHVNINLRAEYTIAVLTSWLVLRQGLLSALIIGSVSSMVLFSGDAVLSSIAITYAVISSLLISMLIMELVHVEHDMNSAWRVAQFTLMFKESENSKSDYINTRNTKIELKNISFIYPKGKNKVLDNISFSVFPGEKVGICGCSGAGKSSIINVLLGLYPHQSGKILIGGYDISNANLDARHKLITTISQTPLTFVGTLRENIDPNSVSNNDEISQILKKIGLSSRISKLPNKIDTLLENAKLSSGEIQLLVLGRALLEDKSIIFMDEVNSDLDVNFIKYVTKLIICNKPATSILLVSHHLIPLLEMDKVLYMDNGKIIEQGDPNKLIHNTNSYFYKLFSSQIRKHNIKNNSKITL